MLHLMIRLLSPDCVESQKTTTLNKLATIAFGMSSLLGCKESDDDCDSGIWSTALQPCIQEEEDEMCADPVSRELCDDDSSECGPNPICDKGPEETAMDDHPIVLLGEELKKKHICIYTS